MARTESIISLDPIDRKRKKGVFGRLMVTRYGGGKKVRKDKPFGHYMFCGSQGSGKTASALWYAEKLGRKYKKKGYVIKIYSNIDIGIPITRDTLFNTINVLKPSKKEIRIVIIDEIHTYFPKEGMTNEIKKIKNKLIALFSQLRKRNTFILSTAQVYGRLDKSLREQCLYMIDCKVSFTRKLVNDFIKGDNIICDELGRWAGDPSYIYKHGLPKNLYETTRIISD